MTCVALCAQMTLFGGGARVIASAIAAGLQEECRCCCAADAGAGAATAATGRCDCDGCNRDGRGDCGCPCGSICSPVSTMPPGDTPEFSLWLCGAVSESHVEPGDRVDRPPIPPPILS